MQKTSKTLVFATLALIVCSMLASTASAQVDNTTREQAPDTSQASDSPMLIATQDGNITGEDGTLYQARDNSTATDPSENREAANGDVLIATQSNPDYTAYIIAGIALVAVVVICSVVIIKKRK